MISLGYVPKCRYYTTLLHFITTSYNLNNELLGYADVEYDYDVFSFTQGYAKGWGVMRASLYTLADIATLFLAELLTNPVESVAFSGKKMQVKLLYSDDQKVAGQWEKLAVGELALRKPAPDIEEVPVIGETEKVIGQDDVAVVIGIERYQNVPPDRPERPQVGHSQAIQTPHQQRR